MLNIKIFINNFRKAILSCISVTVLISGLLMVSPKVQASSEFNKFDYITERSKIANQLSLNLELDGQNENITTMGVKSKAVVKVAQLLRAGGDEVIDAARRFNIIDSSTAKTFKNNSKKIGNWLTRFEYAGSDAATMVRKQLPVYLKENTRMSKGTAENIAIAVSWAIRMADVLFF